MDAFELIGVSSDSVVGNAATVIGVKFCLSFGNLPVGVSTDLM